MPRPRCRSSNSPCRASTLLLSSLRRARAAALNCCCALCCKAAAVRLAVKDEVREARASSVARPSARYALSATNLERKRSAQTLITLRAAAHVSTSLTTGIRCSTRSKCCTGRNLAPNRRERSGWYMICEAKQVLMKGRRRPSRSRAGGVKAGLKLKYSSRMLSRCSACVVPARESSVGGTGIKPSYRPPDSLPQPTRNATAGIVEHARKEK